MSVIQNIREKYAKWAVVAIALALLGFILTDYLSTRNQLFGGSNSTTLGSVNGKKIEYIDFENKLRVIEAQAQARGQQLGENERHQNIERLWSQEVEQIIMNAEFNKVGISVGKKELNDWLFGSNPPQDLKQQFSTAQGQYDVAAAQNAINQMKRSANQAERDQLNSYIEAIEYSRQMEKYNSLLSNTVYYPKWYVEKQNAQESGAAKISYLSYPYAKISDTTVKISDQEIAEYISKHKEQYKQEESRSISYVVFSASPTAADSAAVKAQVAALKPEFEKAPDPAVFLARFGSAIQYFDGYVGKSQIQISAKDSLFALSKNAVYGPYHDNNSYAMAKLIETKNLPDSVYCRHILFRTSGEGALTDSVAEKKMDSTIAAINAGAGFVSVMKKVSMDEAANTQDSLGIMRFSAQQIQNAESFDQDFAKYILFEGTKGQRKKVKTKFGYHYIEVVDQKNFQPYYKIAYFAKNIVASDETDRNALGAASKFASESRDMEAFDNNFEKTLKAQGYQKLVATNIKPNDNSVEGINVYGFSRQMVREIYKADGGDVLPQQRVGDKYIVATVTGVYKEGAQPVYAARPTVEPLLRNKKKAEKIKEKIGKLTTLDAATTAMEDQIKTIDSLRFAGGQLGFEPKILGAAFNAANKGKLIPEPLAGTSAVYVVRVDDLYSTPVAAINIEEQKKQLRDRTKQMTMFYSQPTKILSKGAKIKDNRRSFY